jgi:hypothetical protein
VSLPRSVISSRHEFEDGDDDMGLEFPLTYVGPLPSQQASSPVKQVKHDIRRRIHNQLRDLVERSPELKLIVGLQIGTVYDHDIAESISALVSRCRIAGFHFVPLVIGPAQTACHLDIRFLRRERPGHLITKPKDEYGGDLDNRLKIFLDALRVPSDENELPAGIKPEADEEPFYCLLQDDSLITKFQVASDMLLGTPSSGKLTDVQLVVDVLIRRMPGHWIEE